jgi:hypothetical protein
MDYLKKVMKLLEEVRDTRSHERCPGHLCGDSMTILCTLQQPSPWPGLPAGMVPAIHLATGLTTDVRPATLTTRLSVARLRARRYRIFHRNWRRVIALIRSKARGVAQGARERGAFVIAASLEYSRSVQPRAPNATPVRIADLVLDNRFAR